jgi:hypothetical protein
MKSHSPQYSSHGCTYSLLFWAGYSRISAPSPGGILATLRIIADHYPERLAKAFIVDASSMFYYAWKVGRPFCMCKNKLQYMLISFQILMFLLT